MDDEFLGKADLQHLTGASTVDAQQRALEELGIPFLVRQSGRRRWLVVSRYHLRAKLEGRSVMPAKRPNIAAAT